MPTIKGEIGSEPAPQALAPRGQRPKVGARRLLGPAAHRLQADDMRLFGTRATGAIARRINTGSGLIRARRRAYAGGDETWRELLRENGGEPQAPVVLRDGYAWDHSRSLPHLDALLAAGATLIEENSGQRQGTDKPFLYNIADPEVAVERFPELLDFICSSEVIAASAPSFGYVPMLAGLRPTGIRVMESSTRYDPAPEGPWRASQLYHLDYHSSPTLYVIVALRDIGPDDGPLHFIGREASQRIAAELGYGRRGVPYRLTDEQVFEIVDPSEVQVAAVPAGTVLFIESSACFHMGSRNPATDRYQLQYSLVSPVSNDFMELWQTRQSYPVAPDAPQLRRFMLERTHRG